MSERIAKKGSLGMLDGDLRTSRLHQDEMIQRKVAKFGLGESDPLLNVVTLGNQMVLNLVHLTFANR